MNEKLKKAKKILDDVFSDTSVPPEQVLENLMKLREDLDEKIDAMVAGREILEVPE